MISIHRCAIIAIGLSTLVGCDSGDITLDEPNAVIVPPAFVREIAAVDSSALSLQVTVDEQTRTFRGQGAGDWAVTIAAPTNANSEIKVAWFQSVQNTDLLLAEQTTSVFVGETAQSLELQGSYVTQGEGFDQDNDGFMNLVELRERRNPLGPIDLVIPNRTNFLQATTPLDTAVEVDASGNSETGESRFSVRHDGTNLQIYVCAKDTDLVNDSDSQYWHDDNVEIYIDGDNSKGSSFDRVNDFHLAYVVGSQMAFPSSQSLPVPADSTFSFQFDRLSCDYELNVTLSLQSLGITVGQPFGFDLEIIDDDTGGVRDAKYVWIGNENNSFLAPSTFGTVVAEN